MKADAIIGAVKNLAAPSGPAARLLELLRDPTVDSSDVIQIVRQDAVMTAKLLSLCNSSAVAMAEPVSSIEHALFYLGQNRVFQLAVAISFGGQLSPRLNSYAIGEKQLWNHSLLTAMLMKPVLDCMPEIDALPSLAYTAGLVHDIGKVVLDQALVETTQSAIRDLVIAGSHSLCEAERSVIDVDHAEVGARLLEKWRLPEEIVEAVAHHHAPVVKPRPGLSCAVHFANVLAHQAGPATGWGSLSFRAEEEVAEGLGLTPQQTDLLVIHACTAMEQVQSIDRAA